jgi:hypothetical protein
MMPKCGIVQEWRLCHAKYIGHHSRLACPDDTGCEKNMAGSMSSASVVGFVVTDVCRCRARCTSAAFEIMNRGQMVEDL